MVERVYDGFRLPPAVSLTSEELQALADQIDAGTLPSDYLERHFDGVDAAVFGVDAPKKNGRRQEQGLGSPSNQTPQSVAAYRKWGKDDPDYEVNLKKMEKQLEATEARKKAEAAAAGPKRWMRR